MMTTCPCTPPLRRTIHDPEMPSGVQHTGVRLLLNLVEVLVARSKSTTERAVIEQHRQLLHQMLVTHLAKLTSLERQVPKLMAAGTALTPCTLRPALPSRISSSIILSKVFSNTGITSI